VTPIVNGIKRTYWGRLNVVFVSVDKPNGKRIAKELGIVGTPTILLLDREGNRVNILRGALPQRLMEREVEDLLEG
jgi:thioredoxin-like negative regulator of GroEL